MVRRSKGRIAQASELSRSAVGKRSIKSADEFQSILGVELARDSGQLVAVTVGRDAEGESQPRVDAGRSKVEAIAVDRELSAGGGVLQAAL